MKSTHTHTQQRISMIGKHAPLSFALPRLRHGQFSQSPALIAQRPLPFGLPRLSLAHLMSWAYGIRDRLESQDRGLAGGHTQAQRPNATKSSIHLGSSQIQALQLGGQSKPVSLPDNAARQNDLPGRRPRQTIRTDENQPALMRKPAELQTDRSIPVDSPHTSNVPGGRSINSYWQADQAMGTFTPKLPIRSFAISQSIRRSMISATPVNSQRQSGLPQRRTILTGASGTPIRQMRSNFLSFWLSNPGEHVHSPAGGLIESAALLPAARQPIEQWADDRAIPVPGGKVRNSVEQTVLPERNHLGSINLIQHQFENNINIEIEELRKQITEEIAAVKAEIPPPHPDIKPLESGTIFQLSVREQTERNFRMGQ